MDHGGGHHDMPMDDDMCSMNVCKHLLLPNHDDDDDEAKCLYDHCLDDIQLANQGCLRCF